MNRGFRAALLGEQVTFGGWLQIGHPAVAEVLARSGFDWVCVDLEHGLTDLESMGNAFRALGKYGCAPVARLPYNDVIWMKRALDAGAAGIIVPMVNTAEDAERALTEAKYPPRGRRGFGFARANEYGVDFAERIRLANDDVAVILQIEHKDAIRNLDAILSVADVDALFIGPMDLSGSYGKPGDLDCPEMRSALNYFLQACAKHRTAAGLHIVAPDAANIDAAIAAGYRLIALGVDAFFLASASAHAVRTARGLVRPA
ncbi:MAG: aldolase/citrate lyase family protein [Bryobacteraceae bacterium]